MIDTDIQVDVEAQMQIMISVEDMSMFIGGHQFNIFLVVITEFIDHRIIGHTTHLIGDLGDHVAGIFSDLEL